MIVGMVSQHARKNRNYRPEDREYDLAKGIVEEAGYNMDHAVRAFLRWLNEDPSRLPLLEKHLKAIKAETPRGRPRRDTSA